MTLLSPEYLELNQKERDGKNKKLVPQFDHLLMEATV